MRVDERRLTSRVLGIWNALPPDHDLPRRSALVPDALGRDSADCLLIAIDAVLARSRLIYVGEKLRNPAWSADQPQDLLAYDDGSLVRLAAAKIPAIVAKRGPITFGGTGVHDDKAILYRTILLPLSEDGDVIDHVIGAINFREIADSEEHPLDEAGPTVTRGTTDKVLDYLAFSSRRVSFAPRQPTAITIP